MKEERRGRRMKESVCVLVKWREREEIRLPLAINAERKRTIAGKHNKRGKKQLDNHCREQAKQTFFTRLKVLLMTVNKPTLFLLFFFFSSTREKRRESQCGEKKVRGGEWWR